MGHGHNGKGIAGANQRQKKKCQRYKAMHKREMHKIKRVLRSNGLAFAEEWARKHNVVGYLGTLTKGD